MITAADIAFQFKLDPLSVLQSDAFDWALRCAATEYVVRMQNQKP